MDFAYRCQGPIDSTAAASLTGSRPEATLTLRSSLTADATLTLFATLT